MTETSQYGESAPGSGGREGLRAQAMEALDFGTVRQRVAGYARFHLARRRALDLSPTYTPGEVDALQAETSEGLAFLAHGADVSLHAVEDPTPLIERAALEGVLPGADILIVAESVEVLERARSAFRATDNFLFVVGDTKHGFVNVAAFPQGSVIRAWVEGTERGLPDSYGSWAAIDGERGAQSSYGDWTS